MSRWESRSVIPHEQWSVSAWVCRMFGCGLITIMQYDEAERRWVTQHGPNPEHVLLIPSNVGGYISVDNPAESDIALPSMCKISIDDWLRRVHARPAGAGAGCRGSGGQE